MAIAKPYKPPAWRGPGNKKATAGVKKVLAAGPSGPTGDYGQDALYPGGYQGTPNPVDWSRIFTDPTYKPGGYATASGPKTNQQPDYGALIAGDWEVQDAEAAMAAGMARARGDFQGSLRSALIDLGIGDVSKLGNLSKYIDKATIEAALSNKYSSTATNRQQAVRNTAMSNASLAARGILNSGQTTKNQTDIISGEEGANYSGLRNFLEGGAQGLTGLADREEGYARAVAAARAAAAQRAAEMYPRGPDPILTPTITREDGSTIINPDWVARARGAQASGPAPTAAQLAGKSSSTLSKAQFYRKNPKAPPQGYYNYLRAWYRQRGIKWG